MEERVWERDSQKTEPPEYTSYPVNQENNLSANNTQTSAFYLCSERERGRERGRVRVREREIERERELHQPC